jgi:hypothetical protein
MTLVDVPEGGDVIIRAGGPDGNPAYVLRSVVESDQLACGTRAEAEKKARALAEQARVNVWFAGGPDEFTLLVRFRGIERRVSRRSTAGARDHPQPQSPETADTEP